MAVDTQDKRASVLGFGLAALLVLPSPGTITQPDRQQVAYSYAGIAAAAPVVSDPQIAEFDVTVTTHWGARVSVGAMFSADTDVLASLDAPVSVRTSLTDDVEII